MATTTNDTDLGERAAARLREMIAGRILLPGQKLRQTELSEELGFSRSPVREALRSLHAEGLITHEPKRGYSVARLTESDLLQIYRMRDLLEDEVLSGLRPATRRDIADLRATNRAIADAIGKSSVERMVALNRRFHFRIFGLSTMDLIRHEIDRLWNRAGPYQGIYAWLPDTRARMYDEHEQMVDALEQGDIETLIFLLRAHRRQAQIGVLALISPGAR